MLVLYLVCTEARLVVWALAAAQQRKRGLVVSAAQLAPEAAKLDAASRNPDPSLRALRWFSQPLFDDVLADADAAAVAHSKKRAAKHMAKAESDSDEDEDEDDTPAVPGKFGNDVTH